MPHVNIKHFPSLTNEQHAALSQSITDAISRIIGCDKGVISIAVEPVEANIWNEKVYVPEIINRQETLIKKPDY